VAGIRSATWPARAQRALRLFAVGLSLYAVETVFHLAAVVDTDALAAGDAHRSHGRTSASPWCSTR
jgi:hypothetical protein